jgi:glycerol-3-phosphate cytidylyltransferase
MPKTVITYGTFDTLHWGHIELLRRAKELSDGGKLIVGLSTDEFNTAKGKKAYHSYEKRKELLSAVKYVDKIIPEEQWPQKIDDVKKYKIDLLVMGDDWKNSSEFEEIGHMVRTEFLPRTPLISSTDIRNIINKDSL